MRTISNTLKIRRSSSTGVQFHGWAPDGRLAVMRVRDPNVHDSGNTPTRKEAVMLQGLLIGLLVSSSISALFGFIHAAFVDSRKKKASQ